METELMNMTTLPVTPQDTVAAEYSFEEHSADSAGLHTEARPRTVAGVLRLLPPDATPEQQDSIVQAMVPIPEPTDLSTRPDTLNLPGLIGTDPRHGFQSFDFVDGYFSSSRYFHPEIPYRQNGMAAEPVTYRLSSDDYVKALLLMSFFIAALFIARNIRNLKEKVKNFLRPYSSITDTMQSTNTEIRGQTFLILQTCLTIAVLFFDYTQWRLTDVFNQNSPYVLLGIDTLIAAAYFAIKFTAYRFVNWIFFDRSRRRYWGEVYLLSVMALDFALFVVAMLVVYFDLALEAAGMAVLLIVALLKTTLFIKCKQIFFNSFPDFVHLILYFCTLEILPVLLLWKALVYFNEILTANI